MRWLGTAVGRPLKGALSRLGYEIVPKGAEFPPDFDAASIDVIRAVRPFTVTTPERVFALCEAVRYLHRSRIEGAIVECGVWRGGSMMAAALTLLALGATDRELYLFDTFQGMTPPTARDIDLDGKTAEEYSFNSIVAPTSVDDVRANLESTGYPSHRTFFVAGRVEETIPLEAPAKIALLRLDTDWYQSTLHELVHLYPRIQLGGVLIVDDYGHWRGSKDAVDEYVANEGLTLLLNRIDYTARMAIVPASPRG